ncbi:LysR family transcriptional regulator [Streptomyces boluensis]|uniref:LysR family transcriptional regulator n=1 Tax=Streptomyces boluensis TaxID=1775135 RepID=A0A964V3A3_9ACTN|nr:LysR substrate-binding domain-containing protein [Streptomyces boluensis]NBE56445.1 LysR family transcriptional regulator [Streptomyces boluensis]
MAVELRHLRCFLAIAEAGTITRAATRLHMSQPALSRSLRALEEHLGARLVDRSTHHLELTPEGRVFRDRAAAAVAAVDAALDPSALAGRPLRLGHTGPALGEHTAELLRRWDRRHPSTPLELLRVDDRTAGLLQGKVDAALLRAPLTAPGVATETLLTEARLAVVAADSALARHATLTLADLADQPLAINTVSGITRPELWPAAHRPTAVVTVTNTEDWHAAIAAGRAIGVTPASTPRMMAHSAVAYRPLTDAPDVPVLIAWPERGAHPAIPDLLALARETVAPGPLGAPPAGAQV